MDFQNSRLDKVYTDMYEGGGAQNPSVTTRLAQLEDCSDDMEVRVKQIENKIDKGMWLLIGILLTGIVDLILRVVK
jgi:hypothetical protein